MDTCPCCSASLLRHIRHSSIYWYCPHCRQEMPNLESILGSSLEGKQPAESRRSRRGEAPRLVGLSLVEIVELVKQKQKVPA